MASFSGNFDGDGFAIKNVTVNRTVVQTGFFNYLTATAVIQNLTVETSAAGITGAARVGGIAGEMAAGAKITNCKVRGKITGTGDAVGGIAGYARTSITECVSNALVTGNGSTGQVGGISGYVTGGTVSKCVALGTAVGYARIGGITGEATTNVIVENCASYSFLNKSTPGGYPNLGGIVGHAYNNITIRNCLAAGLEKGGGGSAALTMTGGILGGGGTRIAIDKHH